MPQLTPYQIKQNRRSQELTHRIPIHPLPAGRDALIKIKCNIDAWLQVEAAVIISSASGYLPLGF
jgi:hypothetical protein